MTAKTFLDSTLTITPHKCLNCSRDVISESDLLCAFETEILDRLSDQGVTQIDHQIGTPVHAPQRPMATYIGMSIVVPGPHGLLCH
ncbi:hypothetical protein TNCV_4436771 [Trichonephila clavipes]|nr:hypothetical protein TNCV_4436771 [Trichonephila clavipes]